MRIHILVMAFVTVWFSLAGIGLLFGMTGHAGNGFAFVIPLGMMAFGYALTRGGFLFEASQAKKLLTEIT